MNSISNSKPELLAPAGSPAAFDAAIEAGADAIYLGLPSFNARINANNFTPADIGAAFLRAHAYGVKIYVTLNTLIFDREREDFLRTAKSAYLAGADGFIVADLGAAAMLRKSMPDVELHASTQVSGHNVFAAERLRELGFTRMVLAREMSEEDISGFVKSSPIEAEVFVHGALCVCHSGQCLFSSLVGGRSGNRGECAQPCRLPYNGKNNYPLSLKDLSLAQHADKLSDMGVASFKIEGRMKSAEYVRDVTRIWRRLIDEHRGATPDEMRELSEIFSRGGLTDSYFKKNVSSFMLGTRSEGDKQKSRELKPFEGITRKLPIDIEVKIKAGEPSSITVANYEKTVCGDIPEAARTAPLDRAAVEKNILKLGGTPYYARKVDIELDEGLILPVSSINRLRREAIASLSAGGRDESGIHDVALEKYQYERISTRTAVFYEPKNITQKAKDYFDIIYTPLHLYDGRSNGVLLPAVVFDSEREEVLELLRSAAEKGASHALVGNIGHIDLVRKAGLKAHADHRFNISNSSAAKELEGLDVSDFTVSAELTLPQIRDIGGKRLATVYGKLPLMTLEKCVIKEISDCKHCENEGFAYLVDRKGVRFAVRREFKHRNIVFNSVPVYMADRSDLLCKYRVDGWHFIFCDESKGEIDGVIDAYISHRAPKTTVRRINIKND